MLEILTAILTFLNTATPFATLAALTGLGIWIMRPTSPLNRIADNHLTHVEEYLKTTSEEIAKTSTETVRTNTLLQLQIQQSEKLLDHTIDMKEDLAYLKAKVDAK